MWPIATVLVLLLTLQQSVVLCKYVEGHLKTHEVSVEIAKSYIAITSCLCPFLRIGPL